MNFGLQTFRELIEDFLASSGGRRGREREARREEGNGGEESESTTDAEPSDSETAADETESEPEATESGGGGLFGRGSNDDEEVDDLVYRIQELEEELESKESTLGTVQDSQQQVAQQVEEVNDTVRQLLGVYDMVTDDVNPFTGAGEEKNGFGVFGEDDDGTDESGGFGLASATESAAGSSPANETVSFDDLKGALENAAQAQADGGETIAFDENEQFEREDDRDTRVEVQATESVDEPDDATDRTRPDAGDENRTDADVDSDDVTLATLADTYATDIIVFEWLTQLVRTGGSAATLRAISYYAEIGWIDEEVKAHLEGVLSGPDLDIHVDPETTPEELTAEDHADSYTYIMKLQEIHETRREVEPERTANSRPGP
ncbi:FlaD/FlaE family flagellar protein [Natronorubrum texcoconense]|uniref:Archaellum component FlaD/FlaE n=1 Tax=Natronorubrum texcoconense TaxID=1095776 RepID=A0A1G9F9H4_9EURY|nr:FlaD/FlaE family flagellar protein [Natronorubrum texcoconense]SDK85067.1 Archaellum component FlaD/FlaE [Natronorubrum texcoconense]